MDPRQPCADEVLFQLHQLYPDLPDPEGWLWTHTSYPLYEGDDAMSFWLNEIEAHMLQPHSQTEGPSWP